MHFTCAHRQTDKMLTNRSCANLQVEQVERDSVISVMNCILRHTNSLRNSFLSAFAGGSVYRNYNCNQMGLPLSDILKKLEDISSLKLAESWDNVGLLIEAEENKLVSTVLLTIDLTEDVVDEAIDNKVQMIITYHPNIFRPMKCITQSHWKERIAIKCIKNNILVFSPHTSWDAMLDGVNDWLASFLDPKSSKPIIENKEDPNVGMGRLITLETPLPLKHIIEKTKKHIGIPYVRVGVAKHKNLETLIKTVAVCAGSGSSVLSGVEADLYLTGEMLHHDVLDANQKGTNVILCNHSDSERGFLKEFVEKFHIKGIDMIISKRDKDCLSIV